MAILVYGRLISHNGSTATYEISKDGTEWRAITFSADENARDLQDDPVDKFSAISIAVKSIREYRRTGEWPTQVTYAA